MRNPILLAVLRATFVGLVMTTIGWSSLAGQDGSGTYAFENVSVVPMDSDRILSEHTVVVRDGVIADVGPSASLDVPPEATRIDGEGRYLTPGLAEMAASLPAENDPLRVVILDETLFLYLANGVTTIRSTNGADYQLALRQSIADGKTLGPTLYVGSPRLDAQATPSRAVAEEQVQAYDEAGFDFLTIGESLSLEAWNEVVRVAEQEGLPFGGRIPADVELVDALESGMSTLEGLDRYLKASRRDELPADAEGAEVLAATDDVRLQELARATADAGIFLVPAQYLADFRAGWSHAFGGPADVDTIGTLPELSYVPKTFRDGWETEAWNLWSHPDYTEHYAEAHVEWRQTLLEALHGAGSRILLGGSSPALLNVPGFAVHRETPRLIDAGLTPFEVLKSGTVAVAQYSEEVLGQSGDFGTITSGNRADLLLLEENPLESVNALKARAGVMVRGRWLPEEEIQERLAEIAERHKEYEQD